MRRSSAFTILFACVGLVLVTALAAGSLIAANAWTPVGERPAPTPRPTAGGPGGPEVPVGGEDYEAFLAQVQAGRVRYVDHQERMLYVESESSGYSIEVPSGVGDVYADIVAAAAAGGVDPPRYAQNGLETPIGERSYEAMLGEVAEGAVFAVTQAGDDLFYDTERGRFEVVPFDAGRDVVADLRAAAAGGGVQAPAYTWYEPE